MEVVVAGGINWDTNLFVERFPRPGEEASVIRITRGAGGKGGNVSVAVARLLGPDKVAMIGALGSDEIADSQLGLLRSEGVETSGIARMAGAESGQAYIVTDSSGENLIHTHFGANAMLDPADILNKVAEQLTQSARIAVVMDPPEEIIETVTRLAYDAGKLIAWDPGIRAKAGMERLRNVLMRTRYLFLNETEVEYMTGLADPPQSAERLLETNPDLITIVKSGREGCTLFGKRATIRVPGIDLVRHGLQVVNTVGCGDAFLGAFAAAKALDLSDEEAPRWANWAGALKASKSETRGSPTISELKTWMSKDRNA